MGDKGNDIDDALARAVRALGSVSEKEIQKLTLLDAAIIMNALPSNTSLSSMRKCIAQRFHTQLSTEWIKNGDMLEVFSALTALWKYNQAYVTGERLVCAIQRLVDCEVTAGGPYCANGVIAVDANIQIALFVRLIAGPLPNMERFMADSIASKQFQSLKYTESGLFYLLTEAFESPELIQCAMRNLQQESPLVCLRALRARAIKNSEQSSRRTLLAVMCAEQLASGFWEGVPLTKLPATNSRLTTTALSSNTLTYYLQQESQTSLSRLETKDQMVAAAAAQLFNTFAEPLRTSALTVLKQVCDADKNFEITLLPQFFGSALKIPSLLTHQHYTVLGLANLYVWIAYTIYDDFLDDEGNPAALPVANIAMRASLECFKTTLPTQADFSQYVAKIFTGMDEANAWEVGHCRFIMQTKNVIISELPHYGNGDILAARAFAHALAPMAVLAQHVSQTAQKSRAIEAAFRHYLVARQLNDDIHDWLKDMRAGHASYVVTAILRDMRVKPGTHNLDTLLPAMQRCFRQTTVPRVCRRMLRHIATSRRNFASSQLLQAANDMYTLLDTLESSVQLSLDKHAKGQALAVMQIHSSKNK